MRNNKGTVLVVAVVSMMIMMIIALVCLQMYTNQGVLDTYEQIKMRTFYSAEGAIEIMRGYIDKKMIENLNATRGDVMSSTGNTFLFTVTPYTSTNLATGVTTGNWEPFSQAAKDNNIKFAEPILNKDFDGTMYPGVRTVVYLHRLTAVQDRTRVKTDLAVPFRDLHFLSTVGDGLSVIIGIFTGSSENIDTDRGFEIVATASADFKTTLGTTSVVSTTIRYYFVAETKNIRTISDPYYETKKYFVGWRVD